MGAVSAPLEPAADSTIPDSEPTRIVAIGSTRAAADATVVPTTPASTRAPPAIAAARLRPPAAISAPPAAVSAVDALSSLPASPSS